MTYPSNLPTPSILSTDTFETVINRMLERFRTKNPDYGETNLADVSVAVLDPAAYENVQLREQANETYRQLLVGFATGSNLDWLAHNVGVTRLLKTAAVEATETTEAVPATYEEDEALRRRINLAWHSLAASGTEGWYLARGLTYLLPDQVESPIKNIHGKKRGTPGTVYLYLQVEAGDYDEIKALLAEDPSADVSGLYTAQMAPGGVPTAEFTQALEDYLSLPLNRIINDTLEIKGVTTVGYRIEAELTVAAGNIAETVRATAEAEVRKFAKASEEIDNTISLSRFYAVLQVPGVEVVTLISPAPGGTLAADGTGIDALGNVVAKTAESFDGAKVPIASEIIVRVAS